MTDDAPLIGMASPDRCPTCGADMAPDQHYCVECGNRRGKPRFSLDNKPAPVPTPVAEKQSRFRLSSSATLLLGILVLMLALYTGTQLEKNNGSDTGYHSSTPKITINNTGGSSSGDGETADTTSTASGTSTKKAATSKTSASKPTNTTKVASLSGKQNSGINIKDIHTKAQRKAATKKALTQTTKLKGGKSIGSEKTTIGSKCSDNVVGCQNGKYTGNYFGG